MLNDEDNVLARDAVEGMKLIRIFYQEAMRAAGVPEETIREVNLLATGRMAYYAAGY